MPHEILIEYSVAPDMSDEADEVRGAFLAAVERWGDPGFGYRMYGKGDGEFVHVAWLEDEAAQARLGEQDFFKTFTEGMRRVSGGDITATRLDHRGAAGASA